MWFIVLICIALWLYGSVSILLDVENVDLPEWLEKVRFLAVVIFSLMWPLIIIIGTIIIIIVVILNEICRKR